MSGYKGKNYDPNYAANKARGTNTTTTTAKTNWNANAKPFQPAALRAAQQVQFQRFWIEIYF